MNTELRYPLVDFPSQSFNEVPEKMAVVIELAGCKHKCRGCHSPENWEGGKVGLTVNLEGLLDIVEGYIEDGCSAIAIMGGDENMETLLPLLRECSATAPTALYIGSEPDSKDLRALSRTGLTYIKTGRYIDYLGGLESPQTNQRFYKITPEFYEDNGDITTVYRYDDWTHKFTREDFNARL